MDKALSPILRKEAVFYDDQLTAVRGHDGNSYVSWRTLCAALAFSGRRKGNVYAADAVVVDEKLVAELRASRCY